MKPRELDYSTRDYEGFRTDMLQGLQERIPEYTDLSQTDAGVVILELLANGLDLLSYYNDKTANEVYLDTARERENIIQIAKLLGYTFDDGRPSEFDQVFEIIPQDSTFVIPRGYVVKTTENTVEPEVVFELAEDLVIPPNCVGNETDTEGKYLYSVPIIQGYTKPNEIVGTSTEAPNQQFYLAESPVIKDSVTLSITESNGVTNEWERVPSFLNSSPSDLHFTLTINASDQGIITFGNGKSGKIPTTYSDGIIASYRIGGGEQGNVSATNINQVEQKISGIVKTYNPYKARVLGVDKEEDAIIKEKAPKHFKTSWALITKDDYTTFCERDLRVLDAVSVPGNHPLDMVLYILPKDYAECSENDLVVLKNYLLEQMQRKALGVDIFLNFAKKLYARPKIKVTIEPTYYRKDLVYQISCAMKDSFGGNSRTLGQSLHPSEVTKELMQIAGVKFIECDLTGMPKVSPIEVLYVNDYDIEMIGGI